MSIKTSLHLRPKKFWDDEEKINVNVNDNVN